MPDNPDNPGIFRLFVEIGIINQLSTSALERLLPHALTLAQFSLLNHLVTRDPQPPLKLASAFQVSKGTMTSTIGRLEAKGFVAITPNPKDGRGKFVAITPAGRAARSDSIVALRPLLAWLATQIEADETTMLVGKLAHIRALLDARRDGER